MNMESAWPETVLSLITTCALRATLVTSTVSVSRVTAYVCLLANYGQEVVHDFGIAGKEGLKGSIFFDVGRATVKSVNERDSAELSEPAVLS